MNAKFRPSHFTDEQWAKAQSQAANLKKYMRGVMGPADPTRKKKSSLEKLLFERVLMHK